MRRPFRPAEFNGPILDAVKVTRMGSKSRADRVTYCVIESAGSNDKRSTPRRRTRLRSGKIIDSRNRFLIECQIYDRSPIGARLRLLGDTLVPRTIGLYEDENGELVDAHVIWRKDSELGIRFLPNSEQRQISKMQLATLGRKYYAID
jgi:hypothetical protein